MATIVLDSKTVLEMCDKALDAITEARTIENNKTIDRVLADPPNRFSWRKLKWLPVQFNSKEDVIEYLDKLHKEDGWQFGWIGWRSYRFFNERQHIKKLKALAMLGDPVTLNEQDVDALYIN